MGKNNITIILIYFGALILSSCTSFPRLHPYVISLKHQACGEYEVVKQTDACNIEYHFVQWHNLSVCEGFFALPPEDIAALREYQAAKCANKNTLEAQNQCEIFKADPQ